MLQAMMSAAVGDDVFGEDPTVNALEEKAAAMFGMEAAVYCPSGTMTNQIGVKILTQPYEEVICYEGSHIYKYEGGGLAGNSGLSFKLLNGRQGRLAVDDVVAAINPDDIHFPVTSVVALENTVNKGGGSCYELEEIRTLHATAKAYGLSMHLDGARLFNALVATGDDAIAYGSYFDTISICLSKGLGAPVGSLLLGSKALIRKARRVRKYFGGGMRQAGYLAAAGLYALDHHIERLKEDHQRAQELAEVLRAQSYVEEVLPVETNIVIFRLPIGTTAAQCLSVLQRHGLKAVAFGPQEVRLVTHLDYTDELHEKALAILKRLE